MMSEPRRLELIALGDAIHADGVAAGGGGAVYTQEQLDQAVAAAVVAEKDRILAGLPAVDQAEDAALQSLVQGA